MGIAVATVAVLCAALGTLSGTAGTVTATIAFALTIPFMSAALPWALGSAVGSWHPARRPIADVAATGHGTGDGEGRGRRKVGESAGSPR